MRRLFFIAGIIVLLFSFISVEGFARPYSSRGSYRGAENPSRPSAVGRTPRPSDETTKPADEEDDDEMKAYFKYNILGDYIDLYNVLEDNIRVFKETEDW